MAYAQLGMHETMASDRMNSRLTRFVAVFVLFGSACSGEVLVIGEVMRPDAALTPQLDALDGRGVQQERDDGAVDSWLIELPAEEVARRLSLFIFNVEPTSALTEEVVKWKPRTNEDVGALTQRLLHDQLSAGAVRRFYTWWLKLDRWEARTANSKVYPDMTPEIRQTLLADALTFAVETTWGRPGTFAVLMTAPVAYVTGATPDSWFLGGLPLGRSYMPQRVQVPSSIYAGLLTQPAVVSAADNSEERSITRRAITILESLLCGSAPPPPPNVPALRQPREDETFRQWWEDVTRSQSCVSCHRDLDPLGLVFENFNGVGALNLDRNSQLGDASTVLGPPLFDPPRTLSRAPAFAAALSVSPMVWNCFAGSWLAYATGLYKSGAQALASPDQGDVEYVLKQATIGSDLNLLAVIRAVTETRSFLRPNVVSNTPAQ